MPVRQPAGGQKRALGRRTDGGEDGGVAVAHARAGWVSSSSSSGRWMSNCRIRGSSRSGRTRTHGTCGGFSRGISVEFRLQSSHTSSTRTSRALGPLLGVGRHRSSWRAITLRSRTPRPLCRTETQPHHDSQDEKVVRTPLARASLAKAGELIRAAGIR